MRIHLRSLAFLGLLAAALMLALGSCTTDSPTEPQQQPTQGGGGGGTAPSGTWNITILSSRSSLEVNSGRSATITVRVRDAANNALPPNGAVISIFTSLGDFNEPGSGETSVLRQLFEGLASVALFPGDEAGTAVIQARLEQSVGQLTLPILEPVEPAETPIPDVFFLERVEPDEGRPEGGDIVRILGQEISEPVRVFFGGLPADVLSVSSNAIRVRTPRNDEVPPPPALGRLPVDVIVTINANQVDEATDTLVSGFTYTRGGGDLQPIIFSVTPNLGPNEGGTRVVINGDGFESAVQVTFEEGTTVVEAEVESVSRTQIVVISPAAVGFGAGLKDNSVDIRVRNLANGLETLRADAFRYGISFQIFNIDPISGPATGGTRVTIFGEGFDEPLVVDFGSTRQQVTSVTGNQILVRTVPVTVSGCVASGGGPVTVTHLESSASATGPSFNYQVEAPDITGTIPATIPQAGGVVRILGRNFQQPLVVMFDGRQVTITSVSPTEIVATFPAVPNSSLDEDACDANFDGFEGERFVVTALELSLEDDQGCTDTFAVNVSPTDTSCRNDVAPTPTPGPTATPTATMVPP